MNCHFEVAVFLPFGVENNFLFSSCFLHPFFLLLYFLIRFFLIAHETIYQLLSLKGNSLQLILVQFFFYVMSRALFIMVDSLQNEEPEIR